MEKLNAQEFLNKMMRLLDVERLASTAQRSAIALAENNAFIVMVRDHEDESVAYTITVECAKIKK